MSYNGQILHVKHFCVTLSGPITFEAVAISLGKREHALLVI